MAQAARCSFCGKDSGTAGYVVAGPSGVGICDECAEVAREVAHEALRPEVSDRVLTGIGRLVTNDRRRPGVLGVLEGAAVAIREGRVTWVGSETDLPSRYRRLPRVPCDGRMVTPGFVECHTHLIDLDGAEGADAHDDALDRAVEWAGRLLSGGVTCLEVQIQPGPGSEGPATLALAAELSSRLPVGVRVAWDPAGLDPVEAQALLPVVSRVATRAVVGSHVDDGWVAALRASGMRIRMRWSADVAPDSVERLGPLSIEHVRAASAELIAALSVSDTVAVVAPVDGLSGELDLEKLVSSGVPLALSTDCSPAGIAIESPVFAAWLAAAAAGIPLPDGLWGVTRGGALALGDLDRGWVGRGARGDLVVLDVADLDEIARRPDSTAVAIVIKDGDVVVG